MRILLHLLMPKKVLNREKCIDLTFDECSKIYGRRWTTINTTQKDINIFFIHCFSHKLNLTINDLYLNVDTSKELPKIILRVFGIIFEKEFVTLYFHSHERKWSEKHKTITFQREFSGYKGDLRNFNAWK